MYLYMSRSVHSLAKWRKLLPGAGAVPKLHMYNTNTHNKNKLLLLATGIRYHLTAALNQMGNSHSSSALSHIPTPASPQTPRLASQPKGSGASGQRSQIPPLRPRCRCHPSRKGQRHIWCREERSREQRAFRCCAWKAMTTFVLYIGNVWVQCWQSGSDWKLSS